MRWLFFKNSVRKSKKKLIQIGALGFLISLFFIGVFGTFAVNLKVGTAYNEIKISSNLRQVVMDVDSNTRLANPTKDQDDKLPESQELYQQYVLNQLAIKNAFEWSKTEEWTINNITNQQTALKLKVIAKFDSVPEAQIDKLVLAEGSNFSSNYESAKREVIFNPTFAKANNIKIGSIIRLQPDEYGTSLMVNENPAVNKDITAVSSLEELLENSKYYGLNWYKVIGFGSSVDFAYPLFSKLSMYPKAKEEALVYVDARTLGFSNYQFQINYQNGISQLRTMKIFNSNTALVSLTSEFDRQTYYSLKATNPKQTLDVKSLNGQYKQLGGLFNNQEYFYSNNDKSYRNYARINNVSKILSLFNLMSGLLVTVIFSITIFIFYLVSKKELENELAEIGYLKSMGYKNDKIIFNYLALIIFACLFGYGTGVGIFIGFQNHFINLFTNIFNFEFTTANSLWYFELLSLIVVIGTFLLITSVICYHNFNRPLTVLNFGVKNSKISWVAIKYKQWFVINKFDNKLRAALFISSFSKILGVAMAMLLCATLTSSVLIIPQQIKNNYQNIFANINYKNKVMYTSPVSNNPLSFLKTYNPYFSDSEWGFDFNNKLVEQYIGSRSKDIVSTAYPLLNDDSKEINWKKVTNDILNNNIHTDYYSYDIAKKHNTAWAEFSWINWKNLSTSFLLELDNAEIDDSFGIGMIGAGQTMKNIYSQWNDFATLENDLAQFKKETPTKNSLLAYCDLMLNFYKKYSDALPLTYNKKLVKNNMLDNNQMNKVLKNAIAIKNNTYQNFWKMDKDYNKNYQISSNKQPDFDFYLDKQLVNIKTLKSVSLKSWAEEDIKRLNNNLTLWFASIFEWRLGTSILMLTYTNTPYYIQQKIINALEKETTFAISNSIVPYNQTTDELGTTFKAKYDNLEFDVYGIDYDSQLTTLLDKKNQLLNQNLFNTATNTYDIVINQALAKKLDLKTNELIDLEVINAKLETLIDNQYQPISLDDVQMGWTKNPYKDFRTQSSRSYYSSPKNSSEARNFSDTFLGIPENFTSANFGSESLAITNNGALGASKQPPIHKQVTNNELRIGTDPIRVEKPFKVVGIENSYGKPQAWIANSNANKVMEYDRIQKFNFENFFVPEWAYVNDLYTFENFNDNDLKTFLQSSPSYSEFQNILQANSNLAWDNLNKFYNNLYPVFNYKLSSNPELDDLVIGLSTTQRYGDFSEFGTRGSYEMITPPGCEGNENGQECEPIINKDKYYEGFSTPSISTLSPVNLTKNIIEDLAIKLNLIIYIFITILLMITLIILLLATTLIIEDNHQFIKTMKILGYSNLYIIKQIFRLYNSWIILIFTAGLGLGIYSIYVFIAAISNTSSYVFFANIIWWYPLGIFGLLLFLYLVTFIVSWLNVKKLNK
ncbi:ABC transporter permease [Mesoplasma syrphidae]|uniref:ABC transporter permease n=1 Tax=Mesoplasma syrphidae TaxID=225999 RepID=A0A2K9CCY8_9MOLU|nr:ABC transporter permease [Mesoplasma syrphidae]AUF83524.1 ABC transporter permease [Mesoplasma syrphidae]